MINSGFKLAASARASESRNPHPPPEPLRLSVTWKLASKWCREINSREMDAGSLVRNQRCSLVWGKRFLSPRHAAELLSKSPTPALWAFSIRMFLGPSWRGVESADVNISRKTSLKSGAHSLKTEVVWPFSGWDCVGRNADLATLLAEQSGIERTVVAKACPRTAYFRNFVENFVGELCRDWEFSTEFRQSVSTKIDDKVGNASSGTSSS